MQEKKNLEKLKLDLRIEKSQHDNYLNQGIEVIEMKTQPNDYKES